MACTVPGCSSRCRIGILKQQDEYLTFHRFPADPDLKKIWSKNVRKGENWTPSQFTRICSLHFEDCCYHKGYGRKILHSYAVPTIFPNQPLSCQPKLLKKRKLIAKYNDIKTTASTLKQNESLIKVPCLMSKKNQRIQTDNGNMYNELYKAKKSMKRYKDIAEKRGRMVKSLQRKISHITKKNVDLKEIVQIFRANMEIEHFMIVRNAAVSIL